MDIVARLRKRIDPDDPDLWVLDRDRIEAADEIEKLRNNADLVLHEATRLLELFVAEHFPTNADWKPQPDLLGVILQLDNASTIAREYKAEIERLRLRLAVLERFVAGVDG